MRICLIGDGASIHVQTRARAFTRRGHEVVVISERPANCDDLDIRYPEAPGIRGYNTFHKINQLKKLLKGVQADIYNIHYAAGYGPWLCSILGVRPLVVSAMGGDVLSDEQMHLPAISRWMTRRLLLQADGITAVSEYVATRIRSMGIDKECVINIPWGVDISRFRLQDCSELRRTLDIKDDMRVVFSPRILKPFYNVDMIVDGFFLALSEHPNVVLVIAGYQADPEYERFVKNKVQELGIADKVRFVGSISFEEIPLYYGLADVTVSAAPSDGTPISMLESMASKTPVILTRLDRYKEFVSHDESAWFVGLYSESIGNGLIELLGDQVLRERLSEAAFSVVMKKGDLETNIESMERLFEKQMGESENRSVRRFKFTNKITMNSALYMSVIYFTIEGLFRRT